MFVRELFDQLFYRNVHNGYFVIGDRNLLKSAVYMYIYIYLFVFIITIIVFVNTDVLLENCVEKNIDVFPSLLGP